MISSQFLHWEKIEESTRRVATYTNEREQNNFRRIVLSQMQNTVINMSELTYAITYRKFVYAMQIRNHEICSPEKNALPFKLLRM